MAIAEKTAKEDREKSESGDDDELHELIST
jgi:hypothetical protein